MLKHVLINIKVTLSTQDAKYNYFLFLNTIIKPTLYLDEII